MDRPGCYSLAALSPLSTALTSQEQTAITDLEGMGAVTLEAELLGGTGGTSVSALVQTRLGSAGTWRTIARFDFTVAGAKFCVVAATADQEIGAFDAMSAEGAQGGFLGDQLRCVVTSVGTYTSSAFYVRASVR